MWRNLKDVLSLTAVMSPSTGLIFNNQMDDFATDKANVFSLQPSKANYIVPGRRPMSSMSPTVVVDEETQSVRMVIGGSGGPSIISSTAFVS